MKQINSDRNYSKALNSTPLLVITSATGRARKRSQCAYKNDHAIDLKVFKKSQGVHLNRHGRTGP